jgi:Derlin-2/3
MGSTRVRARRSLYFHLAQFRRSSVQTTQQNPTPFSVKTMRSGDSPQHKVASMLCAILIVVVGASGAEAAASFSRVSFFPPRLGHSVAPRTDLSRSSLTVARISNEPCLARRIVDSFPRGGGIDDDVDDDEEDDDENEDFDDDGEDDAESSDFKFDDEIAESDFAEDTTVDRVLTAWKNTPPLTKGYLTASAVATIFGFLFGKNEFPKLLLLDWEKVLTRLQIWRPFTAFLNFGPLGIGYLMTAQFVWVYMSTLERLNHNRPYDFWTMILFGQLSMVIVYPLLKLRSSFLGHNLSTFLVYIWSRYHDGVEVNMFELFNVKAEMLPWMFLAQTFLLEGEPPILDFLGIVFGHLYHHCKTVGILRAPESLSKWYDESEAAKPIRDLYKPISSDFDAP